MKAEDYYFEKGFKRKLTEEEKDFVRESWSFWLKDMVKFATEYAKYMCELQKQECADNAKTIYNKKESIRENMYVYEINKESILETPNVCEL